MTDLFYADSSGRDIGIFSDSVELDCDINSGDYDFELRVKNDIDGLLEFKNWIYIPGTEIGGIIQGTIPSDSDSETVYTGKTWRGLFCQKVIEPTAGTDYRVVNGDINTVLSSLFGSAFGSVFSFNPACGKTISNFQIDRYVDGIWFLNAILDATNYRIDIRYNSSGDFGVVDIGFVPITDYSSDIEISEDYNIKYKYSRNTAGINHIIGAGKGELKDRTIIHYYADANGNISKTKTFTGIDERVYFFDYSSAESTEVLDKATKDKLKELISGDKLEFDAKDFDFLVHPGDIIGGSKNGMKTSAPVESTVAKLTGGKLSLEHKVKDKAKG